MDRISGVFLPWTKPFLQKTEPLPAQRAAISSELRVLFTPAGADSGTHRAPVPQHPAGLCAVARVFAGRLRNSRDSEQNDTSVMGEASVLCLCLSVCLSVCLCLSLSLREGVFLRQDLIQGAAPDLQYQEDSAHIRGTSSTGFHPQTELFRFSISSACRRTHLSSPPPLDFSSTNFGFWGSVNSD